MLTSLAHRATRQPALDLLWRVAAIAILALAIFVGLPLLTALGD